MRTITTKIYEYSELSEEAKKKAREDKEEEMREHELYTAFGWAIDDCALLEPKHSEMVELFGEDYYEKNGNQFLFKNNRSGLRYNDVLEEVVGIGAALEITNDLMFEKWLGIPEMFADRFNWSIDCVGSGTELYLSVMPFPSDDPRSEALAAIEESAKQKFDNLLSEINDRVQSGIEEYFGEENVESRLEDLEFLENGEIYE